MKKVNDEYEPLMVVNKNPDENGTSPIKWDTRETLLLKSSKLEIGGFCYGQKSVFGRNSVSLRWNEESR